MVVKFNVGDLIVEVGEKRTDLYSYRVVGINDSGAVKLHNTRSGWNSSQYYGSELFELVTPAVKKKISDYKSWL